MQGGAGSTVFFYLFYFVCKASFFLIYFLPCMNSDQCLSHLHLMNKAAESEDRQSDFYYLKLAEQTLQRQDPEALWKPAG